MEQVECRFPKPERNTPEASKVWLVPTGCVVGFICWWILFPFVFARRGLAISFSYSIIGPLIVVAMVAWEAKHAHGSPKQLIPFLTVAVLVAWIIFWSFVDGLWEHLAGEQVIQVLGRVFLVLLPGLVAGLLIGKGLQNIHNLSRIRWLMSRGWVLLAGMLLWAACFLFIFCLIGFAATG